jgi:anti-sigma factor RsiW
VAARNGHPADAAPTPVELMEYVDGELGGEEEARVRALLETDTGAAARQRVAGMREVGELVRGHLELATDAREDRLRAMWLEIDKQIDLETAPAREPRRAATPAARQGGVLAWLGRYRGHLLTGMVSAGAVAAIAFVMRPGSAPSGERATPAFVAASPAVPSVGSVGPVAPVGPIVPVVLPREAPVIESVEAGTGSSMVFTIEDDDGSTAVVWVTPDDTVEGL